MPQELFTKGREKVLIALGSNQASDVAGTREIVEAALVELADIFGPLSVSNFYRTPCFPHGSGPEFVNATCLFDSAETPREILGKLHSVEARFGRTRDVRWGARSLDLDLIAFGQHVIPDLAIYDHWRSLPVAEQMATAPDELILPHPRVQDRSFVLVPLADIAPDWVHPVLGQTVLEMLAQRPDSERAEIARL